ncbi:MAG TPA: hypothetical protein VGT04_13025 [Acidobacteriaceae bacterium]|nr:hypothetical protein [Acidobacteriaceae bacterium]
MKCLLLIAALACLQLHAQQTRSGPWVMESSGTTAGLRGIHAVGDGSIAWASGTGGTILRTEDAGYLWQRCAVPPDAAGLDFRGIWAWDENTAIVMSSGPGNQSRIYKTTDGCAHWKLLVTNPDKDGFWDAMAFSIEGQGYVLGDPVRAPDRTSKEFQMFISQDFGGHWSRQTQDFYDEMGATNAAGAFAASNSSLSILHHHAWFGTGGTADPYVFIGDRYDVTPLHTMCSCIGPVQNETWITHRVKVPMAGGNASSGIFSLAFRDRANGIAVGGDYKKPNATAGTAAWTSDGGEHWTAATKPPHGFRSAVAWDPAAHVWITAGTNGSDVSYDDGRAWTPLDNGNWNAISLPYIVGPHGRIAKLDGSKLPKR